MPCNTPLLLSGGMDTQNNRVLLDSCVASCLLAKRGDELDDKPLYEDLLSGMQYVVCPITEAESLHLNYTRGIGPERVAEQREFLDEAEFLSISSSTAKICADLDWPGGGHQRPGQNDQWLVAIAKEHGIPLATKDKGLADKAKDIVEILHVTKPDKDKPKKNKKSLLGFLGSLWIRPLPS